MTRPRWHDALVVLAIVALACIGVRALWWDDVRAALHLGGDKDEAPRVPATPSPQT